MRNTFVLTIALVAFAANASAQTLFDEREKYATIREYGNYIASERAKLFSSDSDDREDGFERVENSLERLPREGDAVFPIRLLGDLVLGEGMPADGELDDDLQEDAVDLLIELATGEDYPVTLRELAAIELGRIGQTKDLSDFDFSNDSHKALSTLAKQENLVLAKAAILGIAEIAKIKSSDGRYNVLAEYAAEELIDLFDDDNYELRRAALLYTIRALESADSVSDATENLWEEMTDALDEIESHRLLVDVKQRFQPVIAQHLNTDFKDLAEDAQEELASTSLAPEAASDTGEDVLQEILEQQDPEEIESSLLSLELESQKSRVLYARTLLTLTVNSGFEGVNPYKLRLLLGTLLTLTWRSDSSLQFYASEHALLGIAQRLSGTDKAGIPLTELGRLMASTEEPALLGPALDGIHGMAMAGQQPAWVTRRLITLLFLQAGDSPNPAVRQQAFERLADLGRKLNDWGLRYEVLIRMDQLAKLAKDEKLRAMAAAW